jgi:hypothetical protein
MSEPIEILGGLIEEARVADIADDVGDGDTQRVALGASSR